MTNIEQKCNNNRLTKLVIKIKDLPYRYDPLP